ncbi:cutinase family protein [Streptomyces odontomachi]|uniref:cutinase family protein n=1 Tax=Streptomyces odontomachi TaxID=2944940 RepID=UPI00210C6C38|nr:PE-PPE domain-containing protein [Streptomyces sp. ODS25]
MSSRSTRVTSTLIALAATAGCAVAVAPGAQAATAQACPQVAVFETDGYGHGETMDNWNASSFNHNTPAGWQIVQVPYYSGIFPVVDKTALDESVAAGAAKVEAAVRDFHADCPASQLKLAGYSEGAAVAGDALADLAGSSDIPHGQISGTLYGDPRRDFGDGGVGGVAGGIETNLPTILPGVTMRGGRDFKDVAVREVCNENDAICNSANMITNLLAFANGWVGYASGDHGYDLNPAKDTGNGLTLHTQQHRIDFGPPLPLPIGTPWQIQNLLGDTADAKARVVTARDALPGVVGADTLAALHDDPWFRLIQSA